MKKVLITEFNDRSVFFMVIVRSRPVVTLSIICFIQCVSFDVAVFVADVGECTSALISRVRMVLKVPMGSG